MKQRTIELSFNNHEEMFNLPINPAEFEFTEAHNNQRITLLNIGEVNLIGHRGLVSGSLSGFFPSTISPLARYADREPMEYIRLLKKWKSKPQPIVYVEDPETGEETDLLYGTLGDYRQPVPAYNPAYPSSVFNFPLELVLSNDLQVLHSAPAGIATWDDLRTLKSEIIRSIMMGEVTLPLAAADGEVLLTSSGTPIHATYKTNLIRGGNQT